MGHTFGGGFALIVVLFILLIIVGASWLQVFYDEGGLLSRLLQFLYAKGGNFMSGVKGNFGGGFALLVVLFILLIIIGASWL